MARSCRKRVEKSTCVDSGVGGGNDELDVQSMVKRVDVNSRVRVVRWLQELRVGYKRE